MFFLSNANTWSAILTAIVVALLMSGLIKFALLDSLLKTVQGYKERLEFLERKVAAMERDNLLKTRQLSVSLRIIEFFEQIIAVFLKNRKHIPDFVNDQIDEGLLKLATYRRDASLDLEAMQTNTEHYDWLLARDAIMGKTSATHED